MKYDLRSLMTFSIRDLALVTVIVALAVGWSLTHRPNSNVRLESRELRQENEELVRKMRNLTTPLDADFTVEFTDHSVRVTRRKDDPAKWRSYGTSFPSKAVSYGTSNPNRSGSKLTTQNQPREQ